MKLLVTGGAGFIGSNFIRYWLENHPQDEIVNLDVLTYAGNLQNLTAVENNPNYTFVKGDILDAEVVDPLVKDCDIVVHFAAESHVDRSILGPMAFVKTNFEGTAVLLEAARKYDKRFHHISTDEVFGSLEYGEDRKFNEDTAYDPKSPYSASKAASDHLVRAYGHTFGLKYTISNCTNNFGAYHFPEKFIPLAITNLMEGKPIPIYGDGQQIRDWLYVDDHSRAVDLIIHKGEIGHTYGIGGLTEEITNLEVARKILALMDKDESHLEYVQDRLGHDVRYAVDWSKSKKMLGYEPAFDFDENLKMTVEWYKNNEEWWRAVKDGSYEEYYAKNYKKLDA